MDEYFKKEIVRKYKMMINGLSHHFLGIKVYQDDGGVFIYQKKSVERVLRTFGMFGC
jgi:hypothetical protein